MSITPILAEIKLHSVGDEGLISQLWHFLIIGMCIAIIYCVGYYFFTRPKVPPIVLMVWNGFFVLVGAIVVINFLMGLGGQRFIAW